MDSAGTFACRAVVVASVYLVHRASAADFAALATVAASVVVVVAAAAVAAAAVAAAAAAVAAAAVFAMPAYKRSAVCCIATVQRGIRRRRAEFGAWPWVNSESVCDERPDDPTYTLAL